MTDLTGKKSYKTVYYDNLTRNRFFSKTDTGKVRFLKSSKILSYLNGLIKVFLSHELYAYFTYFLIPWSKRFFKMDIFHIFKMSKIEKQIKAGTS